jgi:hypothetical protein
MRSSVADAFNYGITLFDIELNFAGRSIHEQIAGRDVIIPESAFK